MRKDQITPELEAVLERHVRVHALAAVENIQSAIAPLHEREPIYGGSPIMKALQEAEKAASYAYSLARKWQTRTAPQQDLPLGDHDGG